MTAPGAGEATMAPGIARPSALGADFLDLPQRPERPRDVGLTHVIDHGLTLHEVEGLFATAGDYVDIVKLGWGTAYITLNLKEKLRLYRDLGAVVVLGGTLWELCRVQRKLDHWRRWVSDLGLENVEISDGTIALPHEEKLEHIATLSREFRVLSEVGSKDQDAIVAPYRWVEEIQSELAAGAWKVITEARESGTAGVFRADGEVRMGLIDEIVHAVDERHLLFEAPQKSQQVWFIRRFGANVNLGNILPGDVISLETLRLGLRSDTLTMFNDIPEELGGGGR